MKREKKKTRRTRIRDKEDCSSSSNNSLIRNRLGVIPIRLNRWGDLNQALQKWVFKPKLSLMYKPAANWNN